MMTLKDAIANWNAKDVAYIRQVFDDYAHEINFAVLLISLCHELNLQRGSTWLLKKYVGTGNSLSASETAELFALLGELKHWEATLHVLQCLPSLIIEPTQKVYVEAFLLSSLQSNTKFVRAWAYGGYHELAKQHPEYKAEAELLLKQALESEAASVKARIRKVIEKAKP